MFKIPFMRVVLWSRKLSLVSNSFHPFYITCWKFSHFFRQLTMLCVTFSYRLYMYKLWPIHFRIHQHLWTNSPRLGCIDQPLEVHARVPDEERQTLAEIVPCLNSNSSWLRPTTKMDRCPGMEFTGEGHLLLCVPLK